MSKGKDSFHVPLTDEELDRLTNAGHFHHVPLAKVAAEIKRLRVQCGMAAEMLDVLVNITEFIRGAGGSDDYILELAEPIIAKYREEYI